MFPRRFVVGVLCNECEHISFDDPCSKCGHPFPIDVFNCRKANGCDRFGGICEPNCEPCTYFSVGEEVLVISSRGDAVDRAKIDYIAYRNIGIIYRESGKDAGKYPFNVMKTGVLENSCMTCRNRCKSDMRCPLYQE